MGQQKIVLHTKLNFNVSQTNTILAHIVGETFDSDSVPIGIDTCTAACMSGQRADFVGSLAPVKGVSVQGVGSAIPAVAQGTMSVSTLDDTGQVRKWLIHDAYYVPRLKVRLFSPQQWARQGPVAPNGDTLRYEITSGYQTVLHFPGGTKTVPHHPVSTLPMMQTSPGYNNFGAYVTSSRLSTYEARLQITEDDIFDEAVADHLFKDLRRKPIDVDFTMEPREGDLPPELAAAALSEVDKKGLLLRWHYRLGHLPFSILRNMAQHHLIPHTLANVEPPMCAGCLYGKQTRRQWRTKPKKKLRKQQKVLRPGDVTSVDTLSAGSVPGLMNQWKGRPTKRRYHYATVFVDLASDLDFVHVHETNTGDEIIAAKLAYEQFAASCGVRVKHYHCDNGRFAEAGFKEACHRAHQTVSFCGVNAHHQNGIAERRIRDLQDCARSMLLTAKHNWPAVITAHLWGFALCHASQIRRNAPRKEHRSPYEKFTGVAVEPNLHNFHTFGCPVYILDNTLQQQGAQSSKWQEHSRIGIYLGLSPQHAGTVSLVMNTDTGLVSPQFHCKYDERFETVRTNPLVEKANRWQQTTGLLQDKGPTPLVTTAPSTGTRGGPGGTASAAAPTTQQARPPQREAASAQAQPPQREAISVQAAPQREAPEAQPQREDEQAPPQREGPLVAMIAQREAQGYKVGATQRQQAEQGYRMSATKCDQVAFLSHVTTSYRTGLMQTMHQQELLSAPGDAHPLAFAASLADVDTMYLHEAMQQPDRDKFVTAMTKEIADHTQRKHWTVVPRASVPDGHKVLRAVWSMKRKRKMATGEIYRWKARLCVDGSNQEKGVNYWETYSPVVSWEVLRSLLIVALTEGWHTRQLDFVLAYPHAEAECELYMEIPRMCNVDGDRKTHVLRLNRNLYGTKQAGLVWYRHLVQGLEKRGFVQSEVDECVFYKSKSIFVFYVDDAICIGPDAAEINTIIKSLQKDFNLTDEGDLTEYLGIKITRTEDKGLELTQPMLIQRILTAVGLPTMKRVSTSTPATRVLQKDLGGVKRQTSWDYRSVIGMLNFLCRSTRPDLSFAVSQAARFMSNPKRCHERAVMRICQYLQGTADKGMFLFPSGKSFDVYADADFAGGYNKGHTADPDSAKSRAAYHIMYNGCLLYWSSKLINEVCLSTTEAEYVCLSEALRTTIIVMRFFDELKQRMPRVRTIKPRVHCVAFEDNAGALILAESGRMRPRTKHINLKYHHFRSWVHDKRIELRKVDTKEQLADLGTKPLTPQPFRYLRSKLLGW